jgi:TonB-linked SusC/RagA family outer membrane protein
MQNSTLSLRGLSFLKTVFLILFFTGMASFSFAQVRTIKGTVSTSDTEETLPGASVVVKETTTGTVTDLDGKYSLEVPQGQVILVVSFVGYETKEVEVGLQAVVDVLLDPKKETLDEVVVIGYGTVRKSDLTGSVGSIKSDELVKITSSNPMQSLQGRVTGVQVSSLSGAPGNNPTVRIRGVGTFNNTSPIYVVDGVILDDISFLNSADILSMEVLKDASATAIYGSRGANGVIMVTTKSGKKDQEKTVFSINGEYGLQRVARKIDLLNGKEFATIANEIKTGSYNNVDLVPNTDWQDEVFKIAPVQNYQLSASGATKNVQYYLGLGYFNQQGIIDKSSYERVTLKFNNIFNLTSFLNVGTNISLAPFSQQIAPDVTYAVYRAQPVLEPYYPDGSFGVVYNVGNPLADLANSNNFRKGIRGVGNIYAEVNFLKSFTFKTSYGVDGGYYKAVNFTPAFTVYNPDGTASQQQNVLSDLTKASSDVFTWLWENTLSYKKEIKKHSFDGVAGYTMQRTTSEEIRVTGNNLIRNGENFWYINPSYIIDPANNVNTVNQIYNDVDPNQYYSMISFLFRVNYSFDKKYILTATFRRDGSSKFSKANRFSNFPSFAAGWNISQENFMKNIDLISKLKLRASWGKIGNEKISYYDRYSRIQSNMIVIFGIDGAPNPAASYGVSGNPDLKWEVSTQTDVGLEIGLLDDRLTGEFDYYNRHTDDILVALSTPGYYGNGEGSKVRFNAASMVNRGFEFNVGWRSKVNEFEYGIRVLGSTIHNEVLSIGGNSGVDSVLNDGTIGNGQRVTQSSFGYPIGAFYGYKTDGIFQTQAELDAYPHDSQAGVGDLRFVDVNGDGVINGNDRAYIGSPIPKFIFGFNVDLQYKGFDFSLNIQGQTGNKIFNSKEMVRPDPYNFEAHVMDRWTGPGTSDTEPRPSFGGYNYSVSDKFIYDGSFLRIRNVILGYTFPSNWSDAVYMQKLRVYFKVDNLYTFTKYTGYTPEIGSSSVLSNGIDSGIYPISAIYSFGFNITF